MHAITSPRFSSPGGSRKDVSWIGLIIFLFQVVVVRSADVNLGSVSWKGSPSLSTTASLVNPCYEGLDRFPVQQDSSLIRRHQRHSPRKTFQGTSVDGTAFGFFTKSHNNQSKTRRQNQHAYCSAASYTNWRRWFPSFSMFKRKTTASPTSVHLMTASQEKLQEMRRNLPITSFCSSQQVQEDTQIMTPSLKGEETIESTTPVQVHLSSTGHEDDNDDELQSRSSSLAVLYSYTDPNTNITYSALNTFKRKFQAWLTYMLGSPVDAKCENNIYNDRGCINGNDKASNVLQPNLNLGIVTKTAPSTDQPSPHAGRLINTRHIWLNETTTRQELRSLWRQGRLLSDRTEVLAVYQSDLQKHQQRVVPETNIDDVEPAVTKRGGFADLLHMYTDRLLGILNDERDDKFARNLNGSSNNYTHMQHDLLLWLEQHYGVEETRAMSADQFALENTTVQYARLQHFLDWFRSNFPYYYDQCAACGASGRDRPPVLTDDGDDSRTEEASLPKPEDLSHEQAIAAGSDQRDDEEELDDDDDGTFIGYIYPNDEELSGKAGRTELYQCYKCGHFTRFPRYNAATFVLRHRKGRCGEYSMLLVRLLRRLGHQVRWVCDWADHVWAEILLHSSDSTVTSAGPEGADGSAVTNEGNSQRQRRWIHLDPWYVQFIK